MEQTTRKVNRVIQPQVTSDGAGVLLKRSIATRTLDYLDPFLLFDHFGSQNPDDYIAGFPMHPHRGIETVTYMLNGAVNHRDSLGNSGTIESGDVQWMTAGKGILHEEMPQIRSGAMEGFQLWVNLPAQLKMMNPRYQEIPASKIPEIKHENGVIIKVVAGNVDQIQGPVSEVIADPTYLDVFMPRDTHFIQPAPNGHTAFAYLFQGKANFGNGNNFAQSPALIIFNDGDQVKIQTEDDEARFLFVMGKPLGEPIFRYGPFIMNTREEIIQTLKEIQDGTFGNG